MTGPLEWLSQAPLENRKAERLIMFAAPAAVRGVQMAERALLRAGCSAEIADRKRAISAQFTAFLAAAEQQIIAHVQGKIALIDQALSPAARRAAIEQLMAEQAAALIQLRQDIKLQRRRAQRSASASHQRKFKKRRHAVVAGHAGERDRSRSAFGAPSSKWQRPPRAFPAIRNIAATLKQRSVPGPTVLRPQR